MKKIISITLGFFLLVGGTFAQKTEHLEELGIKIKSSKKIDKRTKRAKRTFKGKHRSRQEIKELRKENRELRRKKNGNHGEKLRAKLKGKKDTDLVDVLIVIEDEREEQIPKLEDMSNYKHVQKQRKKRTSIAKLNSKYSLPLPASQLNSKAGMIKARLSKKKIREMKADENIHVLIETEVENLGPSINFDNWSWPKWQTHAPAGQYSKYRDVLIESTAFGHTENPMCQDYIDESGYMNNDNFGGSSNVGTCTDYHRHPIAMSSVAWAYALDPFVDDYIIDNYKYYNGYGMSSPTSSFRNWMSSENVQAITQSTTNSRSVTSWTNITLDKMTYQWPYPALFAPSGNDWKNGCPGDVVHWRGHNIISVGGATPRYTHGNHDDPMTYENWLGDCSANVGGANSPERPHITTIARNPTHPEGHWYDYSWGAVMGNMGRIYEDYSISGTSIASPNAVGLGALLIDYRPDVFKYWPERTKVAMMVTGQDLDGDKWNYYKDGDDGTGIVTKYWLLDFADRMGFAYPNWGPSHEYGIYGGNWYDGDYNNKVFKINTGGDWSSKKKKSLQIVVYWTSNPTSSSNPISDIDIRLDRESGSHIQGAWGSYDNIEFLKIERNRLNKNDILELTLNPYDLDIPGGSFMTYAVAWAWVYNSDEDVK